MTFEFRVDFWLILQLLILPIILPMLVGLVTTRVTSGRIKAILLLALSTITSFLTNLLDAYQSGTETYDLGMALLLALATFALGVGVHYGFLKPVHITERLQETGPKAHDLGGHDAGGDQA